MLDFVSELVELEVEGCSFKGGLMIVLLERDDLAQSTIGKGTLNRLQLILEDLASEIGV